MRASLDYLGMIGTRAQYFGVISMFDSEVPGLSSRRGCGEGKGTTGRTVGAGMFESSVSISWGALHNILLEVR